MRLRKKSDLLKLGTLVLLVLRLLPPGPLNGRDASEDDRRAKLYELTRAGRGRQPEQGVR